jgi:alkylation response protein AidB-like acyl-CoA dehydrogenase
VFAKTAHATVSALLVERDAPGLTIEPLPETMGCKGGEHGHLRFDGVRMPASALVGREGQGQGQGQEHLESR